MNAFKKLIFVAGLMILAGCASGPKMAEVKSSMPTLAADQGRVFFYRSSSMFGAALQPSIYLNGKEVGSSKPGGFFYRDVPAGNYTVTTATEVEKQLTFTVAPKETKYVKTSVSFGVMVGRVNPELRPADEAEKEIAELSYTGAPSK
jgi:hypothetical protein